MVGGVSLVANYRTEFTNAVRESGIDGLIKNLQRKNQAAIPSAPALGRK
jgi:ABC-type transporter MlaC component